MYIPNKEIQMCTYRELYDHENKNNRCESFGFIYAYPYIYDTFLHINLVKTTFCIRT